MEADGFRLMSDRENQTIYYCVNKYSKKCESRCIYDKVLKETRTTSHSDSCRREKNRKLEKTKFGRNFEISVENHETSFSHVDLTFKNLSEANIDTSGQLKLNIDKNSLDLSSIDISNETSFSNTETYSFNRCEDSNQTQDESSGQETNIFIGKKRENLGEQEIHCSVEIDLAHVSDKTLDEIIEMYVENFENINKNEFQAYFNPPNKLYAIKKKNKYVAAVLCKIACGLIDIVFLVSSEKKQYIASDLINRVKALRRDQNCSGIVVEASMNSVGFYSTCGFKECSKTNKSYLKSLIGESDGAVYMQLGKLYNIKEIFQDLQASNK